MAKSKTPAKTAATKKRPTTKARKVTQPKYKSFRMQKRIKHPSAGKLPSSYRLFRQSLVILRSNWRIFGAIALVYVLLLVVLANGINAQIDVKESRDVLNEFFDGGTAKLTTGFTLLSIMIGTSANIAEAASAYRSIITVLLSLVVIWTLRQVVAGKTVRVSDAFYKSSYPFIQFLLVLLAVGLQFIPMAIGMSLYNLAFNNGLASTVPEQFVWFTLIFLLILLSLYMATASLFALYIVTLPDTRPMVALRSARELVHLRRWTVMRKLLALPIVLIIVTVVIMMPFLLYITALAQWVFIFLGGFILLISHTYVYNLYRKLL